MTEDATGNRADNKGAAMTRMTKGDWKALGDIFWKETFRSLDSAVAAYHDYFGVSVKDKSLSEQFWHELKHCYFARTPVVVIPIKLAVAIALRFRVRQRVTNVARVARHNMLEMAGQLWAEYAAQNQMKPKRERMFKGAVKRKAAEAAHKHYGKRAGVTVESLLIEMGRKQRRW